MGTMLSQKELSRMANESGLSVPKSALDHERLSVSQMLHDPSYTARAISLGLVGSDFFDLHCLSRVYDACCEVFAVNKDYGHADVAKHLEERGQLASVARDMEHLIPAEDRAEWASSGSKGYIALELLSFETSNSPAPVSYIETIKKAADAKRLSVKLKKAAAQIDAAKQSELECVVADAMHSVLAGDRSDKKAALKMDRVVEERFFVDAPKEIHTGLPRFDRLAGSMLPGLIVVAGSSGCGKSALLSTMALRMAQSEEKLAVLYFTFDARRQEVADSMIYSVARVDQDARDYTLSTDEAKRVDDAQTLVTSLPIWIDDRRALTIEQIESSILAIQGDAKRMDRTLVVVLDSIQHVKVERGEQDAALQLADVGQRCNVSIIETSGLIERYKPKKSIENETLGTDGPQLADVPGPVSAAASRVILIYNYAAMHRAEVFFDESAPPVESDRVVLIVAKNKRRGGVGRVEVTFTPLYGLFEDKLHTRTESTDTDTYSGSDPGEDVPFDA